MTMIDDAKVLEIAAPETAPAMPTELDGDAMIDDAIIGAARDFRVARVTDTRMRPGENRAWTMAGNVD